MSIKEIDWSSLCFFLIHNTIHKNGRIANRNIKDGLRKTRIIESNAIAKLRLYVDFLIYRTIRSVIMTHPEILNDSVSISMHQPGATQRTYSSITAYWIFWFFITCVVIDFNDATEIKYTTLCRIIIPAMLPLSPKHTLNTFSNSG